LRPLRSRLGWQHASTVTGGLGVLACGAVLILVSASPHLTLDRQGGVGAGCGVN
jgi:hypothetical protein